MRAVLLVRVAVLLGLGMCAAAALAASPCDWLVYDAARGAPQVFFTDPDGTPPIAMRFDADFAAAGGTLSEQGGLDFDGDGKTDVFRKHVRPDLNGQWQHVAGGAPAAWIDMAYAGDVMSNLAFGDFDVDGKTDVLAVQYRGSSNYYWAYSSGGVNSYADLSYSSAASYQLGFGRFDAGSSTDILAAIETPFGSGKYPYQYSPGGVGAFVPLMTGTVKRQDLRLGDFDGDGRTDLFIAVDQGDGTFQWEYSPGGASAFVNLARTPYGIAEIGFGDFDADGKTDPFALHPLPEGGFEWLYWPGGTGDAVLLNTVDGPMPVFGNFVGDARTDALVLRCGAAPLIREHPEVEAPRDRGTQARYFVGEVNGDGLPDLIRTSTCQKLGSVSCGQDANEVSVLLGDGAGGFSAGPWQTLSPSGFYAVATYAGDVTGDGLTDLVWIKFVSPTSRDVYVARAVGDGSFVLGDKQTLSPPTYANPYLIDVNHDGRADLVWDTVCMYGRGFDWSSCYVGDVNQVAVAFGAANGTFALTSPQTLGGAGWAGYHALVGDVNGDGNLDLVFNSTCQPNAPNDFSCSAGTSNLVYTALGDGFGGFTLGSLQTYGPGWKEYNDHFSYMADVSGDGRDDLLWLATCPGDSSCDSGGSQLIRIGLSNGNGTFAVTSPQDLGFEYWSSFRLERGDVNGDGKVDLLLYSLSPPYDGRSLNSGVVHELLSDGSGSFSVSPLQVMSGSLWKGRQTNPTLVVGDVTGDSAAELVWIDADTERDHDRVVVSGDFPATVTTLPTTTTSPATTPPTTTTTLPSPADCAALPGLGGPQCLCGRGLAIGGCAGANVPGKIDAAHGKACTLIDRAATASGKKRKKLLGKALGRLRTVVRVAGKRGVQKNLPAGCGGELVSSLTTLRDLTKQRRATP
jgi:hypothetical protein